MCIVRWGWFSHGYASRPPSWTRGGGLVGGDGFPASGGRWTTFFGAFFETTILRHDLSSQKLTDDLQIFAWVFNRFPCWLLLTLRHCPMKFHPSIYLVVHCGPWWSHVLQEIPPAKAPKAKPGHVIEEVSDDAGICRACSAEGTFSGLSNN